MHGRRLPSNSFRRPILPPPPEGLSTGSGEADSPAAPTLERKESPADDIGDREMGKPGLARCPGGLPCRHSRRQGRAEEGELKAETPPLRRLQVPRVVPPLRAELRMRAMISGKAKLPRLDRACVALVVRAAQ